LVGKEVLRAQLMQNIGEAQEKREKMFRISMHDSASNSIAMTKTASHSIFGHTVYAPSKHWQQFNVFGKTYCKKNEMIFFTKTINNFQKEE
jgi:hypothetical protein